MTKEKSDSSFLKKIIFRVLIIAVAVSILLYISSFAAIFLDSVLKDPEHIRFLTNPFVMKQYTLNHEQVKMFTLFFFIILILGIITLSVSNTSAFKVDTIEITPQIHTPAPSGHGQHGTAKWLNKKDFDKVFDSVIIDSKKLMEGKEHIPAGGLVIGKEDIKKSFFSRKIKEKIYLITKDLHALIIGATRSGKTRNVVIETITMLILAGENVFIPDLKGEIRDYTEDIAKRCGYETICINFINPYESDRKNFLEPIVQALRRKDISRAIEETWSLVSQLVGEPPENGEKLWNNGEAATLAASIMAVCYDNQDHPEYQNLTNVFYFITEMCSDYRGALPLQFYIDSLPEDHPAKILLAATKVAAMRTRSSFYVSAIMTLKLLTIPAINQMTNASDFDIEKLIEEGKKVRREESNNNIPSAPDDKSPCAGSFLLNDGTSYEITENDVENFQQLYPGIDVRQEIRNITGWCLSNPKNRKTRSGAKRFLNGWLSRSQNSARPEKKTGAKPTGFSNFQQRDYDFDALERELLESQKG